MDTSQVKIAPTDFSIFFQLKSGDIASDISLFLDTNYKVITEPNIIVYWAYSPNILSLGIVMKGKVNLAVAIFSAHDDLWDYGWLYLQLVRMLEWESEALTHFSLTLAFLSERRKPCLSDLR